MASLLRPLTRSLRRNSLARSLSSSGASSGLSAFAFQSETNTLAAAFTVPPSTRRKKTMDWAIRTLKGANLAGANPWAKILAFWKVGNDQQSSLINWKTPGTFNQSVVNTGTPLTFTANKDWAGGTGSYLETGIALNALDMTKCGLFYCATTAASTTGTDCGAIDVSANGLTLNLGNSGFGAPTGRVGGANINPFSGTWASAGAVGVMGASRQSSASVDAYFNGSFIVNTAQANSAVVSTQTLAMMGINNNGTRTTAPRNQTCWAVLNDSLTKAEAEVLGNVMAQLDVEYQYGELDTYEAGVLPASVTYDVVCYGMTSQAYMAAYQAKRSGKTVCIVGGWRDRNLNGMSAGGIGKTDIFKEAASGGLPRWVWTQIQAIESHTSTNFDMEPRHFDQVIRGLLDPRMTNGLDIPIYWSNGVSSVAKIGARITSFTTADGRTFNGLRFIDCSYEGDLMFKSGVPTRLGRESSAEFSENLAGYTGVQKTATLNASQFLTSASADMAIDPYNTPATPGSGNLPFVNATYVAGTPANGDADSLIQTYNYRTTMASISSQGGLAKRIDFTVAPSGYSVALYEPLGRQLNTDAAITLGQLIIQNGLSNIQDWNHQNGMSMDFIGRSTAYINADYAGREAIVKAHQNYIKGLFYYYGSNTDARVPAAVRTAMQGFGYSNTHYHRPHPLDDFNWPYALYVREGRRLSNSFMVRQSDFEAVDGTTPRSVKTIAAAAYTFDRHFVQVLADPTGPRIRLEGALSKVSGGTDGITPIPIEAIMPDKADCENLLVVFGGAFTSVAFAPFRMELTSMQAAQSAGLIAVQSINAADQAVQDVVYSTLRTALLASNTLSGEVSPVLPVLN